MNQLPTNISSCYDDEALRTSRQAKGSSLGPAIGASVMLAVAGMGDALLYVYLPVEATALGMTSFIVGVLLSINKFVRFFTNRWTAFAAHKWGIKNILFSGVVISALTTFVYAFNPMLWVWLTSRLFWGVAYSALRFSSIQYAGKSGRMGSALGLGRSIQEVGPVIAYWIGPFLISVFSAKLTFSLIGLATLALLPLFYRLPAYKSAGQTIQPLKFELPGITDVWVFISSFAIEGLLVVGISKIVNISFSDTDQLLIVSALYISSRRFLNIIISPISGGLSDRWKFTQVYDLSCLLIILGVLLIVFSYPNIGVFVAFLGSAMNTTLVPIIALKLTSIEKSFEALTKLSTSRDMGSALGVLLGLILLSAFDPSFIFGALSIVLVSLWFYLRKLEKYYE